MKEIYVNYYEKLLLTASIEVGNSFIAEDIVSNVLVSVFTNAGNYKRIKNPNAWMYRAVMFAVINYKKRDNRYVFTEFIDEAYSSHDEKLDFKIEFRHALEKLPKLHRQIVELHFVYGLTIEDTAKELKISASTVKRKLILLRDELKRFLNY